MDEYKNWDALPENWKRDYPEGLTYYGDYPIVFVHNVLRFKARPVIRFIIDHTDILNAVVTESALGNIPVEDVKQLYREMGYSLCGFTEIFEVES